MSRNKPVFDPIANATSMVTAGNARFTILTSRLIRMEFDPDGSFEDRPSLTYWYRNFETPDFTTNTIDGSLLIETDHLILQYQNKDRFHWRDLSIELKETGTMWRYGDADHLNLGGTTRTLDSTVGTVPLDPGLISRSGWSVVDDSKALVLGNDQWPEPRAKSLDYKDLYFYGYGQDYLKAVQDHQKLSGKPGLLPRWALGNWWSRFWAYSSDDLLTLMDQFSDHQVPLSVCIVDMDWHKTNTGNSSSGWTGYSWNRELFPDPEGFIANLHQRNLKTALNLHPAEGVHPHEDHYPDMATRMNIDPATNQPIPFDIADQNFVQAYFETLHYPLEAQGVDFWWLDWQQGSNSKIAGLDPLFWLNHLHYYDQGKTIEKRPFIFSRWPGLGGQRYPIGFSGDTVVHWKTLEFQPEMTATASNVAFGWWSHDIGGHCEGVEEAELYLRWVQFGVFSPIFRLHSTNNPYIERLPWGYDLETFRHAQESMQLRHKLIPLIYSANERSSRTGEPIILPMYYSWSKEEASYQCPGEYQFCQQLLIAPVTAPVDPQTGFSRKIIWLPPGSWFDISTHEMFEGNSWYSFYFGLGQIPVFAQPGAIIPLDDGPVSNGVSLPAAFKVKVFTGKDGLFDLYEDAGEGQGYLDGEFCVTRITQNLTDGNLTIRVGPAQGSYSSVLPEKRTWDFEIIGISQPASVEISTAERDIPLAFQYDHERNTLKLEGLISPTGSELCLKIQGTEPQAYQSNPMTRLERLIRAAKLPSLVKQQFMQQLPNLMTNPSSILNIAHYFSKNQLLAIFESLVQVSAEKPALDLTNAFEDMMSTFRKLMAN